MSSAGVKITVNMNGILAVKYGAINLLKIAFPKPLIYWEYYKGLFADCANNIISFKLFC